MKVDLAIVGGVVVTSSGEIRADVAVHQGKIVAVGTELPSAERILDADGALLLPGGVDPHVHLDLPVAGTRSADDFFTGTVAAALGGTTCVVDFVTPTREQGLMAAFEERRAEADGKVVVDYGLHMSITGWHQGIEEEIAESIGAGMPTFKTYMAYKSTFGVGDRELYLAMVAVARAGGVILVHAVNGDVYDAITDELVRGGRTAPRFHPAPQPPGSEGEATARAIRLARLAGARLYVVHVTCEDALDEVRAARAQGQEVWAETCIQYLLLDGSHYDASPEHAVRYVLSPPLRSPEHQDALWTGLERGWLQVVSTDHCPFPFEGGKDRGLEDFRLVPNGLPGVGERIDLLHTYGVLAGKLSRSRWVELVSTAPARLVGLYPRKGEVIPGADADLVVYDPGATRILGDVSDRPYDYHPYEGFEVKGRPVHVLSRGELVVEDGRFVGRAGAGRFVERSFTG